MHLNKSGSSGADGEEHLTGGISEHRGPCGHLFQEFTYKGQEKCAGGLRRGGALFCLLSLVGGDARTAVGC